MRWGIACLLAVTSLVVVEPSQATAAGGPCPVWKQTLVAKGLGTLEALLPDKRGGMLVSSSTRGEIDRLTPDGHYTVVARVPTPGQIVWRGADVVMFPTGDALASGALSRSDGTLQLLNLGTRKLTRYATGLTMPNGLALDRDGTAYVTRDLGFGTGITRISAKPGHHVTTNWSTISDTNGIAIDAARRVMYVDQTFTPGGPVVRIPMGHPDQTQQIGDVGSSPVQGLDDLTMSHGVLYLPANGSGDVYSFDLRSRRSCLIATGLGNPSDVTIGTGHGWRQGALFVCGFDGTVREFVRQPG
jgi:hypothetical protein